MTDPSPLRRPRTSGFTLVEVLVAVGLTAILLWGLLQLFSNATRFSSAVSSESDLFAAGRAALERMVRELESAATLDVAYLRISDSGDFDTIQFVAPVAQGGTKLAHVKYYTKDVDGAQVLHRGTNDTSSLDSPAACDGKSFGLAVERFNITYLAHDYGGTEHSGGLVAAHGGTDMPRSVRIEVRLRDPKGQAAITLQSGAFLPGAGL